jgi:hypothetical protein
MATLVDQGTQLCRPHTPSSSLHQTLFIHRLPRPSHAHGRRLPTNKIRLGGCANSPNNTHSLISHLPRLSHVHDQRPPVSKSATQVLKIGSQPPWYSTTSSVDLSPLHPNGQAHQTKAERASERVHPRGDAFISVDVDRLLN